MRTSKCIGIVVATEWCCKEAIVRLQFDDVPPSDAVGTGDINMKTTAAKVKLQLTGEGGGVQRNAKKRMG